MTFEIGQRVRKARPYRTDKYCKYGGSIRSVPIGTTGTVTRIMSDSNDLHIIFDTKPVTNWHVHRNEIEPITQIPCINTGCRKYNSKTKNHCNATNFPWRKECYVETVQDMQKVLRRNESKDSPDDELPF